MNTRSEATEKIKQFLSSDEVYCIVTGTHQYEKHRLVLQILANFYKNGNFLFRTTTMPNATSFLESKKKLETGKGYSLKENRIYVDTIQRRTWLKTPIQIDIAIIYPLMPMEKKILLADVVEDLQFRQAQKVFFVSSFDTADMSNILEYKPFEVIYDVLEEDHDYHQRVLDNLNRRRL